MALVHEDGTGLSTSNSYSTYALFKAYHDDRANVYTDDQPTIEAALIKATDYMDMNNRWRGERLRVQQALGFPVASAWYDDGRAISGVPVEAERACNEYALRAMAASLAPDPIYASSGQILASKASGIGSMRKQESYANAGIPLNVKSYPLADNLLRELKVNGNQLLRM